LDHPQDGLGCDARPPRGTVDLPCRAGGDSGARAAARRLDRTARATRNSVSLGDWLEIILPEVTLDLPDLALNGPGSPSDREEVLRLHAVDWAIEAIVSPHLWN
jgi:hypothetical protein